MKYLLEKSKSKTQQRIMGMSVALKRGELDTSNIPAELLDKIEKIANGMSDKALKDFAKTKHKGLPERIKETFTFKDFLFLYNERFLK